MGRDPLDGFHRGAEFPGRHGRSGFALAGLDEVFVQRDGVVGFCGADEGGAGAFFGFGVQLESRLAC